MNNGTTVSLNAEPNGDLTITNLDGSVTIRQDGTISISTLAPIELTGESLGKLDGSGFAGRDQEHVLKLLRLRGRKS